MNQSVEARQKLIEEGQPLVYSLASRIYRNLPIRVEFDDLVSYGEIGLGEAARDFDPRRDVKFATFAWYRIRGAIYDGVSQMGWTSRARFRRARFRQMANEVLAEDVASRPDAALQDLESSAQWFRDVAGQLSIVYLASGSESAEQQLEDESETASTVVAKQELYGRLHQLIEGLPEQARKLIRSIYYDGCSLKQAASRMGISKSWASRIHAKILEQLARSMRSIGAE